MFVTIDPYYNLNEYHKCISALKKNGVSPQIFISTKGPYNWYLKVDDKDAPKFVFYDELPSGHEKFLISSVVPNTTSDELHYFRREKGIAKGKYALNDAFEDAAKADYACLFNLANKEEGLYLSRLLGCKIWYLGKYYSNKYKVCLCTSSYIKAFVVSERILLEKTDEGPGRFEAEFNYNVLMRKDYIQKYAQTPYFENGTYVLPTPIVQNAQRFINL